MSRTPKADRQECFRCGRGIPPRRLYYPAIVNMRDQGAPVLVVTTRDKTGRVVRSDAYLS